MKRRVFSVFSMFTFQRQSWQRVLLAAVIASIALPAAAQLRAPGSSSRATGIFLPQAGQESAVAPSQPQMGIPQPQSGQKRSQLVDEVVAIVNTA